MFDIGAGGEKMNQTETRTKKPFRSSHTGQKPEKDINKCVLRF